MGIAAIAYDLYTSALSSMKEKRKVDNDRTEDPRILIPYTKHWSAADFLLKVREPARTMSGDYQQ